ncbi:MAG: hypothetical protein CL946_13520 [Ectothiorhodospiraceae bacterium]|nr:hypothetical protein [Ectothiorhodospiraceae bacterium]
MNQFIASLIGFFLILLFPISQGVAQDDKPPPTLIYSTILDGIALRTNKPMLEVKKIVGVGFPEHETSSAYQYQPDQGGNFYTFIRNADMDSTVAKITWFGRMAAGSFWSFEQYRIDKTFQPDAETTFMKLPGPGNYRAEFQLDADQMVYLFDFSVEELRIEGDPAPGYFLNGPWSKYAYLYYLGDRPQSNLKVVVWLRNKEKRPFKKVNISGSLIRDETLVGALGQGAKEITLTPEWQSFEFNFGYTEKEGGVSKYVPEMKAERVLSVNGQYKILLRVDTEIYGVYEFEVEDGKIRMHPKQNPEETDPSERLSSTKGMYWVEKSEQ